MFTNIFVMKTIIQCHKKKSKLRQKLMRTKKAKEKLQLKVKKWTPPTLDPISSSDEEESKMHWDSDDYLFCPQCGDNYPCKNRMEDRKRTLKRKR